MLKMKTLSKQQKVVLRSLALNGKQNIQATQIIENQTYATAHRSIKTLEKYGLIWMSKKNTKRGPKGAQEYSLTPYGVAESILHCDIEHKIDRILHHWKDISPKYIIYWNKFKDREIVEYIKQTLFRTYPNIVIPYNYTPSNNDEPPNHKFNNRLNIIYKNILDTILINAVFNLILNKDYEKIDVLMEIISEDSDYKEIWENWFSIQKLLFSYLESFAREDVL